MLSLPPLRHAQLVHEARIVERIEPLDVALDLLLSADEVRDQHGAYQHQGGCGTRPHEPTRQACHLIQGHSRCCRLDEAGGNRRVSWTWSLSEVAPAPAPVDPVVSILICVDALPLPTRRLRAWWASTSERPTTRRDCDSLRFSGSGRVLASAANQACRQRGGPPTPRHQNQRGRVWRHAIDAD